jgi:hypothetical protein
VPNGDSVILAWNAEPWLDDGFAVEDHLHREG